MVQRPARHSAQRAAARLDRPPPALLPLETAGPPSALPPLGAAGQPFGSEDRRSERLARHSARDALGKR